MDVRFQDGHGLKYKDRRHILVYVGKRNTVESAYSYAMYVYAGYAKHGYVTWLYHCYHVGYAKNLVTPHGYAT